MFSRSCLQIAILAFSFIIPSITALSQAPALPGGQPISASDRIYTADQTSNTITVIKPLTNEVLGTLILGDPRLSNQLNPQYLLPIGSHGLGFSQDGQFLSHVSVTSNTLTVIRTLNNTIVSQTSVDRASHEAFFDHEGKYVWVGCRGSNNVDIVDAMHGGVVARIITAPGPSKVLFSPDGKLAYVNHIKSPTISIIEVSSRTVIGTISGLGDIFSSDMMLSADGLRLWAVHKIIEKTSIVDLSTRRVIGLLETGLESNHPNFAILNGTTYGFVTVAATNETKIYTQSSPSEMPVFYRSIRATGIEPHGIWGSPDNSRMYWVNEHSDTLDVLDTSSLKIVKTLRIGQESQALIYVANAVPSPFLGIENLGVTGLNKTVQNILIPIKNETRGSALVTVREVDGLDMFQVIGRELQLNGTYELTAVCKSCRGHRSKILDFVASVPSKQSLDCGGAPQVLAFLSFFDNYDVDTVEIGLA